MGELVYQALMQSVAVLLFCRYDPSRSRYFPGLSDLYRCHVYPRAEKEVVSICMEKAPTQDLLHRCFFMTFYFFIAAAEASSFSMRARSLAASSRAPLTTASGALAIKP